MAQSEQSCSRDDTQDSLVIIGMDATEAPWEEVCTTTKVFWQKSCLPERNSLGSISKEKDTLQPWPVRPQLLCSGILETLCFPGLCGTHLRWPGSLGRVSEKVDSGDQCVFTCAWALQGIGQDTGFQNPQGSGRALCKNCPQVAGWGSEVALRPAIAFTHWAQTGKWHGTAQIDLLP